MKVSAWTEPRFRGMSLLFYKEFNDKTYIVSPLDLVLKEQPDHSPVEPTILLSDLETREFLQSMANICDQYGIVPSKKPILENELVAVKYHLEDMRRLVFK